MDRPHLRPRVTLRLPHDRTTLVGVLEERLRSMPSLEGRVRRSAVLVWIGPVQRRWWSPCLDLNVEDDGSGTRLVGWYTAHPRLMTATVFLGIFLTFLSALSATWGLVQFQMGETPRCLLGTTFTCLALGLLWIVNREAQKRAAGQMHELAGFLQGLGAVEVDEAHAFDPTPSP